MASLPQYSDSDRERDLSGIEVANLPGHTVSALLAEGKVDEARDELERLLLESHNSGPSIPVTLAFWEKLRSDLRERASRRG
jgi:hypothetical protein